MKTKKLFALILAVILLCAVSVPAIAAEAEVPEATTMGVTRWVPVSVPDYYLRVTYYDGGSYTTPTYYKELRLPSSSSTYEQTGPTLKSLTYDTYYNNVKVKSVARFEYSYTIYN